MPTHRCVGGCGNLTDLHLFCRDCRDKSAGIVTRREIVKEFDRPDRELRTEKQDQAEARRDNKSTRAYGR